MAISLTLRLRAVLIIITVITLNFSNQCTSLRPLDNLKTKETDSIISHVTPYLREGAFLAKVSIGDPPISQLLLIDTGSDLTWIKCYPQKVPFYNPLRSSTYRNASCTSESSPHAMPQIFRDKKTRTCRYYLQYRDLSDTRGVLAEDKLISDGGLISKHNIVFGCGQDSSGFSHYNGVLGLGPGTFSILSRSFWSKFSYCFGSLSNPTYPHNVLILGNGAKNKGVPTPLSIYKDRYYIDLQAISFGGKLLDIEPDFFQRYGSRGGTIIDTGSSHTILNREAYDILSDEIDFFLAKDFRRAKEWDQYNNPCYEGNLKLELYRFPLVTLRFAGGAEVGLDAESLFYSTESGDSFCLAMVMNGFDDMNVIGAMAQQKYNVGYDLRTMNVYFHKTDCKLL